MPNRRRPARRPTPVAGLASTIALGLALVTLAPLQAQAQSSPYYIGLLQTLTQESNVVRLRDDQVLPDGVSKRDLVSSTALIGGINQSIGRQRVFGNASLRDTRFDRNSQYNSQGYGLSFGLDWSTVQRVSGSLSAQANRTPRSAIRDRNDNVIVERNVERLEGLDASIRVGLVTRLSAEASYGQRKLRYSSAATAFRDYDQREGSLGLAWRPGAATTFGLGVAQRRTDYPKLLVFLLDTEDRRKRDSAYASVRWSPSAISTVDARVNRGKIKHDPLPQRDFSVTTGTLGWAWQPGGRLALQTRYNRDAGQDTEALTSAFSRSTDRYRLSATYDLSAKLRLDAGVTHFRRQITGNGAQVVGVNGRDQGETLNLGARWVPTRWLSLGCTASSEKRRENSNPILNEAFGANTFGCSAQAVLQ